MRIKFINLEILNSIQIFNQIKNYLFSVSTPSTSSTSIVIDSSDSDDEMDGQSSYEMVIRAMKEQKFFFY